MTEKYPVVKTFSYITSHLLLFIPGGFLLPLVKLVDYVDFILNEKHLSCYYCEEEKSQEIKVNYRRYNYWSAKSESVRLVIDKIFYGLYLPFAFLLEPLIHIGSFFKKYFKSLSRFEFELSENMRKFSSFREYCVWYCLLPCALFTWGVTHWGLVFLPYAYMFLIASDWPGKLLGALADIVLLGRNSPPALFFKDCKEAFEGKLSSKRFLDTYQEPLLKFCKDFTRDILLISMFGSISEYLIYATDAFFMWLFLYAGVKYFADFGVEPMTKLEDEQIAANAKEESHKLANAGWYVMYKTFKYTSSYVSQNQYEYLHNKKHHTQDPKSSAEISHKKLPQSEFQDLTQSPTKNLRPKIR